MTRARIFWGVFLVAAGVLFLLSRLDVFVLSWDDVWRFWPLLLVIWGAALLVRDPRVTLWIAGVAGLGAALFVFALVSQARWEDWDHPVTVQELREAYNTNIRHAVLRFESGAGKFSLEKTTNELVEAEARTSFGSYRLDTVGTGDSTSVALQFEGESASVRRSGMTNRVEVKLHPVPVWDLSFDIGAASLDLDLRPFLVESLSVEAGAAGVKIRMGDRAQEARVHVNSGVSSVRIDVPASVGCRISAEAPLSRKSFRDFTKMDDGTYQTPNFASAARRIWIDIDAGVSDVRVRKY